MYLTRACQLAHRQPECWLPSLLPTPLLPNCLPACLPPSRVLCSYARTSKTNAVEWTRFTREYFLERESLVT